MAQQDSTPRRKRLHVVRASMIALAALLAAPTIGSTPAQAQYVVGFDYFHDQLAQYGDWFYSNQWGEVWRPSDVPPDFRPYYYGHWEYTDDYGWFWVSDEPFGDIVYHYGRWVYDYDQGWLWVPGYVWGPAWVVWRSYGDDVGWFPMPPGDNFYGDGDYPDAFDTAYGYSYWYGPRFDANMFYNLWIFVGLNHIEDRNFRHYEVPHRDVWRFIRFTRNDTHYTTINNFVVNRSIDPRRVEQVTHHPLVAVPAQNVVRGPIRPQPRSLGINIQTKEIQRHAPPPAFRPWNTQPSGRGPLPSVTPPAGPRERTLQGPSGPATQQGPSGITAPSGTPPRERERERRVPKGPQGGPGGQTLQEPIGPPPSGTTAPGGVPPRVRERRVPQGVQGPSYPPSTPATGNPETQMPPGNEQPRGEQRRGRVEGAPYTTPPTGGPGSGAPSENPSRPQGAQTGGGAAPPPPPEERRPRQPAGTATPTEPAKSGNENRHRNKDEQDQNQPH